MSLSKRVRQTIRRARLMLQAGDRSGAALVLRQLEGQEVRGEGLDATFRCDRLHIEELHIRECLWRRSRAWPTGAARGTSKNHPIASACVGCPVGSGFARRFPDYDPGAQEGMRVVLPPEQRQAKQRLAFVMLGRHTREDPMSTVAEMTPDDVMDWRA